MSSNIHQASIIAIPYASSYHSSMPIIQALPRAHSLSIDHSGECIALWEQALPLRVVICVI